MQGQIASSTRCIQNKEQGLVGGLDWSESHSREIRTSQTTYGQSISQFQCFECSGRLSRSVGSNVKTSIVPNVLNMLS